MLVSELSLRSLIREMLIIEGYKDDQRALIEKYPDSATTINQLKPKWIGWLASRFLVEPLTEVHPFEDAIVTVKLFASTPAAGYASIVLAAHIYKNFPRFLDLFPVYGPPSGSRGNQASLRSWASPLMRIRSRASSSWSGYLEPGNELVAGHK
jgi:hypothetical protein